MNNWQIIMKRRGILAILPGRVVAATDDHEHACQMAWDLRRQVRGQHLAPHYYVRAA
ncbi:hypothetical protein [Streptomyces asiaticus]|uniref:hypothetical protein n=1 Tax=Streptomyces asiaticus TaxID=114695 RepID=UPI00381AE9A1